MIIFCIFVIIELYLYSLRSA